MDVRNASEIVRMLRDLFGEKWGKLLGRIVVIIAVGAIITAFIVGLKAAAISILDLSDRIGQSSSTIWHATILAISTIFMVIGAIVVVMALGQIARDLISSLSTRVIRRKIDGVLDETVALLEQANQELQNKEASIQLLAKSKGIQTQWKSSWSHKLMRW